MTSDEMIAKFVELYVTTADQEKATHALHVMLEAAHALGRADAHALQASWATDALAQPRR
jgi:hypothetical protein